MAQLETLPLKTPCKKDIFRKEYAEAVGDADEKIIRSLIPIILKHLGFPLWYFKEHHLNANGPDFDGILKGSLKRVIAEISNFGLDSYIDIKRAIGMEKAAGPAAYKIHIISFIECYKPDAKKYLEDHNWHLIELKAQVQTEQYYVSMLDKGYRIVLENYEDHLLIEPLLEGLRNILTPIYGLAKSTAPGHDIYVIDNDFDLDYALKQQQVFDELYLESLFLSAFDVQLGEALQTKIDNLELDYHEESHPNDGYDYDLL